MKQFIFSLQPVTNATDVRGPFYVVERFPELHFVVDEEREVPKEFETYEEAWEEAGNCQEGFVLCLPQ
jgi:hypothetical protein